jgi:hypothetical protein
MKIKGDNFNYIIEDFSNPLKNKINKQIYKNYVYNLFKYNQDYRKKKVEKNIEEQKFNACIKSFSSSIRNNTNRHSSLKINLNDSDKTKTIASKNLKKYEINKTNKKKYLNQFNRNNNFSNKNLYKKRCSNSRNKIKNFDTINHFLSNSGTNNFMKENEKRLFLRPISKKKIRAELLQQNDITYSMFNSNIIKCDKKRKNTRRLTSSYFYKKNDIKNGKNCNLSRPLSSNYKRKFKSQLFRDSEEKKPKNKYLTFRNEFLNDDNKINKMFVKFERQISKNDLLIKWFTLIKEKGNKKIKFDKH